MKKQILFSLALIVAMFTSVTVFAQEPVPAKKKNKKERTTRSDNNMQSYSSGWGGDPIIGTGDVIVENRDVRDFTGVSSAIAADIELRQSSTFKVTIEGQKNILDLLETEVKNGKLTIFFKKGTSIRYKKTLIVRIEAPSYDYLGMSGSGNLRSDGALSGKKLDISISGSGDFDLPQLQFSDVEVGISGSGDIKVGGSTERLELVISGSGDLKANDLKAQSVRCQVSGSGNIACCATKELDALVSGSGDVYYSGSPASVKKKVSGSGAIQAR